MPDDRAYQFWAAALSDLPMLRGWLKAPHVAEWWDDSEPFDGADLAEPGSARWIVSFQGRPFAYLQDYGVHDTPSHHFGHLPAGARGIDQFIAVPAMLGQGQGTGFIGQRVRALFAAGVPALGVDPHPSNARAIACYRRLGFGVAGPPKNSPWGHVLPMETTPRDG